MTSVPADVMERLHAPLLGELSPALLHIDERARVLEVRGALERYGIERLEVGDDVTEVLPALHSPLPSGQQDEVLSGIRAPSGAMTDMVLSRAGDTVWVLLTDASSRFANQERLQQGTNEVRLFERQAGPLAPTVLSVLGIAVLEYLETGALSVLGVPPEWFSRTWPGLDEPLRFEDASPFLSHFIEEAKTTWKSGNPARTFSGIWTEVDPSGREWYLAAWALRVGGRPILAIADMGTTHQGPRDLVQRAREQALAHARLLKEIEKKDVLLHSIVHDLRAPMISAHAAMQLLAAEDLPPRVGDLVAGGMGQLDRQDVLIRTILDVFASEIGGSDQGDGGRLDLVDLEKCAREVVETFLPTFELRKVHLVLDVDSEGATLVVSAEHLRLVRVFANLVENALRFSKRGQTVHIAIKVSGSVVTAAVEDEGPGVPPDLAARLFDRFARGRDRAGAAGLGLHFCRITIEGWGGSIGHENRKAGGSRFWFALPLASPDTV